MESKKKIINTQIRAIFRECCIIMVGETTNSKTKKVWTKKGQAGIETHQKKSCHGSKTISKAYGWTKYIEIKNAISKQE